MNFITAHPIRTVVIGGIIIVGLQALLLALMGQPLICTCGYVRLVEGLGAGNSQHLTDWYTLSHIIHGFIFFYLLRYFFPRVPVSLRILMAVGMEVTWELIENSPWVIQHYREQALAAYYSGDSVINSVSDSFAMATGFILAWKFKPWMIIAVAIVMELVALYFIRDNLFLNVLNLIYQPDFIHNWQAAAGS